MATSTIKFYKINFPSDTNCLIDSIEIFLGNYDLTAKTIQNAQYIKHDLDITVKINESQENVNDFDYNYCRIINSDETGKPCYYFIKKTEWLAPAVLKINLHMDTVNTLGRTNSMPGNPRQFTDKTKIIREHKDRFYKPATWNKTTGGELWRKVDKESEGIVPEKIKLNESKFSGDTMNWYLIYKSDDITSLTSPVSTYLLADQVLRTGANRTASKTYTASSFEQGYIYYFCYEDNGSLSGFSELGYCENTVNKCVKVTTYYGTEIVDAIEARTITGFAFKNDNGNLKYTVIYNKAFINAESYFNQYGSKENDTAQRAISLLGGVWNTISSVTCTQGDIFRRSNHDYIADNQTSAAIRNLVSFKVGIWVGANPWSYTISIDDIDRTSSNLIKIIKLPYCPIPYTYNSVNVSYDFGEDWSLDDGMIKYQHNNLPNFEHTDATRFYITAPKFKYNLISPTENDIKISDLESKLWHSDFRSTKLVYDSFAKEFKQENFIPTTTTTKVQIDFKSTGTINSKFGFKFTPDHGTYTEEQDFDDILLVNRNNEETILNNEYLNYIKTGYNYDKKANALQLEAAQRQATASTIGSVLSTLSAIAAFAAAPATGGSSAVAGIGLLTSAVAGGVSTANAWTNVSDVQQKQENAMQAKLAQLAAQGTSTSGTDDVDLMSWYSDNKLWLMEYDVNANTKSSLYNKFDYTGYSYSIYDVPEVDSRYWYNFIQCEPELDYEGTKTLKQSWLDDLKQRYKDGVTVFHNHNLTWKLGRDKENYESWILTTF